MESCCGNGAEKRPHHAVRAGSLFPQAPLPRAYMPCMLLVRYMDLGQEKKHT